MNIKFTETVLRDANQSLIATRMPMEQFEDILTTMDEAGYYSVECWGGATFDSCIRYMNEDPWERLKTIRKYMKHTKLQMLLRGQSLLGYKHYPDDVVRKFVDKSVENGIDIIRIFDALNDINNIKVAVEETLKCGAHPSCAISYTVSPVHNIQNYVDLSLRMEDIGAKSICIKDMSGILTPQASFELVSVLKKHVTVPIVLHSHCTTGQAYMTYLKAIEAGVDVIDTAISSFSGGTSQPATEVLMNTVKTMGYKVDLQGDKLAKINEHFKKVYDIFVQKGSIDIKVMGVDPNVLETQIPGGMYSNLIAQMKAQNIYDRFDEVLREIPSVRKDLGYPPLVTPISQMVGTQAMVNVLSNYPYETVIKEIQSYFKGEYGMPPGEVNKDLMMRIAGTTQFQTKRLSEDMPYTFEKTKHELGDEYDENDVLTNLLFPELANHFFMERKKRSECTYQFKCKELQSFPEKVQLKNASLEQNEKAAIVAILANKLQVSTSEIQIKSILEAQ